MPEISRFYGITIGMFYADHNPPHLHARCGDFEAVIKIRDFTVLQGYLPPRALGMVMEWAVIHNDELLNNWKLISEGKPSVHIDPLI